MAKPPLIAFFLAIIAVLGTVYIADQAGWIDLQPPGPPKADSLWEVSFLPSSDTDRTEAGESISADGHTISFTLSDAQMDGLGDVNLDIRVLNQNVGEADDLWAFSAVLTHVSTTQASAGTAGQPIVNMTNFNTRFDITWSLTDAGAPTLSQSGESAVSNDWKTGASDTLNADFAMSPTACDDISTATPGKLEMVVGGITMTAFLIEGAA